MFLNFVLSRIYVYGRGNLSVDAGTSVPSESVSEPSLFPIRVGHGPLSSSRRLGTTSRSESYLVDPASSHMLVSKIKPCMSKYKPH